VEVPGKHRGAVPGRGTLACRRPRVLAGTHADAPLHSHIFAVSFQPLKYLFSEGTGHFREEFEAGLRAPVSSVLFFWEAQQVCRSSAAQGTKLFSPSSGVLPQIKQLRRCCFPEESNTEQREKERMLS